jgi:hypothetical protein
VLGLANVPSQYGHWPSSTFASRSSGRVLRSLMPLVHQRLLAEPAGSESGLPPHSLSLRLTDREATPQGTLARGLGAVAEQGSVVSRKRPVFGRRPGDAGHRYLPSAGSSSGIGAGNRIRLRGKRCRHQSAGPRCSAWAPSTSIEPHEGGGMCGGRGAQYPMGISSRGSLTGMSLAGSKQLPRDHVIHQWSLLSPRSCPRKPQSGTSTRQGVR